MSGNARAILKFPRFDPILGILFESGREFQRTEPKDRSTKGTADKGTDPKDKATKGTAESEGQARDKVAGSERSGSAQRAQITEGKRVSIHQTILKERNVNRVTNVDVSINVGTRVPRSVRLEICLSR